MLFVKYLEKIAIIQQWLRDWALLSLQYAFKANLGT